MFVHMSLWAFSRDEPSFSCHSEHQLGLVREAQTATVCSIVYTAKCPFYAAVGAWNVASFGWHRDRELLSPYKSATFSLHIAGPSGSLTSRWHISWEVENTTFQPRRSAGWARARDTQRICCHSFLLNGREATVATCKIRSSAASSETLQTQESIRADELRFWGVLGPLLLAFCDHFVFTCLSCAVHLDLFRRESLEPFVKHLLLRQYRAWWTVK